MSTGCIICSEVFSSADSTEKVPLAIRECGHCFHADCLKRWLPQSPTCPVCRTVCEDKPIYLLRLHLQAVNYLNVSSFYQTPTKGNSETIIAGKNSEIAKLLKDLEDTRNLLAEFVKKSEKYQQSINQAMGALKQVEYGQNRQNSSESVIPGMVIDLSQSLSSVPSPLILPVGLREVKAIPAISRPVITHAGATSRTTVLSSRPSTSTASSRTAANSLARSILATTATRVMSSTMTSRSTISTRSRTGNATVGPSSSGVSVAPARRHGE